MHSTRSLVKIYNRCLNNNSTITSFVIINKFKQMDCFATTVFHGIFFSFFGRSGWSGSCLSISVSCFCFTRVLHLRKESTKLGSLIHLLNIWKDLAFLVACLWNINMDIQLLSIGIWSQTCFKSVYYVCLVGKWRRQRLCQRTLLEFLMVQMVLISTAKEDMYSYVVCNTICQPQVLFGPLIQ